MTLRLAILAGVGAMATGAGMILRSLFVAKDARIVRAEVLADVMQREAVRFAGLYRASEAAQRERTAELHRQRLVIVALRRAVGTEEADRIEAKLKQDGRA